MFPSSISLPADADLLALVSPAFDARPPALRHRERIPDDVLRCMEPTWASPRYDGWPVRVVRLSDVWVAAEGLVFDRGGTLYAETVTQHSPREVEAAAAAVHAALATQAAPADAGGPVVLCKKRGVGNYGHWLMEMLPKAHLVHSRLPELDARFLVAAVSGGLAASMAASLALLGIGPDRVIATADAPRRFAELVVVDGLTHHGVFMSPLVLACIDALADAVAAAPPRRLFVTRQAIGYRRLVDEDALLVRANAAGWTPVEPAVLALADQIALFKGATAVAGVMGAALTNIAFAPPGTPVTVFTPAGMPDTFFWLIATLRGLDYTEIRCEQTGPVRGVTAWDTDLVADAADIAELLGIDPPPPHSGPSP